jgi:Methyltransferase domain
MHDESRDFIAQWATDAPLRVVELGSLHTWGEPIRGLFPNADYWGIDARDGDGVDEVANAATWQPSAPVDIVVCSEVFEHTPHWRDIIRNTYAMIGSGGRVVFTCAGPDRAVHGWNDCPDEPGYYANVGPGELLDAMTDAGFVDVSVSTVPHRSTHLMGTDTRGTGLRP